MTSKVIVEGQGTSSVPAGGVVSVNVVSTVGGGGGGGPNDAGDALAVTTVQRVSLYGYNGTTWDRLRSTIANGLVVDVSRVQGTVAVTQSTSPWVVSLASTTITGTVAVTQSTSPWVVSLASTTITGTVAVTQSTSPWIIGPNDNGDNLAVTTTPRVALYGYDTGGNNWDRIIAVGGRLQVDVISSPASGGGPNDAGDALAVTTVQRVSNYGYNGTTWDRLRSTIANGLQVDVTRVQGTVAVTQSTSPWVVSLTSTTITGTVAVTQSTSPWVVNLTQWGSVAVTAAAALTDAFANPTAPPIGAFNLIWNSVTWDRWRNYPGDGTTSAGVGAVSIQLKNPAGSNFDAWRDGGTGIGDAVTGVGIASVAGWLSVTGGGNYDRIREISTTDAVAVTGIQAVALRIFNGATYDNFQEFSATVGVAAAGIAAVGLRLVSTSSGFDPAIGGGDSTDAQAARARGVLLTATRPTLFNGTTYDRHGNLSSEALAIRAAKVGQARLITYGVNARLTARNYYLSHVFAGAGRFQYLTLWHAAGATKNVRIKQILIQLVSTSAAANIAIDLSRLTAATTPATGNPAMTPQAANAGSAAAEVTVLALPTTQGTEASATSVFASVPASLGITAASPTLAPPTSIYSLSLYPTTASTIENDDPMIRAATAEGWAVVIDVSAACTILAQVQVLFTEE